MLTLLAASLAPITLTIRWAFDHAQAPRLFGRQDHSPPGKRCEMELSPDRDQIEIFVDHLFRYASQKGYASLRAFHDNGSNKVSRIHPVWLGGGLGSLVDAATDNAYRAAN